jgi:hypothetical protein
MNHEVFVVGELLIAECSGTEVRSPEEWTNLANALVPRLLTNGHKTDSLSLRVRLAVAIALVGSKQLTYFQEAFRLLCAWDVGGAHWVVLEEMMRHAVIFACRSHLRGSDRNDRADIEDENNISLDSAGLEELWETICDIFPKRSAVYVTNPVLKSKLPKLKQVFRELLSDMEKIHGRGHQLVRYLTCRTS